MDCIVGPTFEDIERVDFSGPSNIIATAFYSKSAFNKIKVESEKLDLFIRLDLNSCDEWQRGMIDPKALSNFLSSHTAAGVKTDLWIHPFAHAKIYAGNRSFLIGSANLSVKGFSGAGHEMLWQESGGKRREKLQTAIGQYSSTFAKLALHDLNKYIDRYSKAVIDYRKANRRIFLAMNEDKTESQTPRASRHGDYEAFKTWLAKQPGDGADLILKRANGQGNLSGHIRSNFFGLRQWMLFSPAMKTHSITQNPNQYRLKRDTKEIKNLRSFVENNAADELGFSLSTWRGYLPKECGGKVGNFGGTIGNLHRMIPLMGRYLT